MNSEQAQLQYFASSEKVNRNGLENVHEFSSRTANERDDTLHSVEFYGQFHRETNQSEDQEAPWRCLKKCGL